MIARFNVTAYYLMCIVGLAKFSFMVEIMLVPSLHAPRAGTRLTVYRAQQVEFQHASQKVGKVACRDGFFFRLGKQYYTGVVKLAQN